MSCVKECVKKKKSKMEVQTDAIYPLSQLLHTWPQTFFRQYLFFNRTEPIKNELEPEKNEQRIYVELPKFEWKDIGKMKKSFP